jgi:hypothetical protein
MSAWAFIAHKDGKWAGVAAASLPKRELQKFLGDFAADGFSITTVENRDEYNRIIGSMGYWNEPTTRESEPGPFNR